MAFMGPSGSGKTTLPNLLGGLDLPTSGSIAVAGDEITQHVRACNLSAWRARHVGFVFQTYNLIPVLTAVQNVELPLLLTGLSRRRAPAPWRSRWVVGLKDRMRHYPRQLSGGQEQRVAIARAIVTDPTFLLCDEPTGDLDRKSADEILALLTQLVQRHRKTILMVTHDPRAAERAWVILHLEKGVLTQRGETRT